MQITVGTVDEYVASWLRAPYAYQRASNKARFARTAEDHRNIAKSYRSSGFTLSAENHDEVAAVLQEASDRLEVT